MRQYCKQLLYNTVYLHKNVLHDVVLYFIRSLVITSRRLKARGRRHLLFRTVIIFFCCALTAHSIVKNYTHAADSERDNGQQNNAPHTTTTTTTKTTTTSECWLNERIKSNEFLLFSHRSYVNVAAAVQPSCDKAIQQLQKLGVHHIDLDLIFDEFGTRELIVSHPTEFKRISKKYSPCSNMAFDKLIQILRKVYGDDYFISLEPKASWGRSQKEMDDPALVPPSIILQSLLDAVRRNHLEQNCAVIVDIDSVQGELEKTLLDSLVTVCKLFHGVRISDELPVSMGVYDAIMPSVEFHPRHKNNNSGKGEIPTDVAANSLFWVVDDVEDLRLAADLRPYGIVSNVPEDIVSILNDPSWCNH